MKTKQMSSIIGLVFMVIPSSVFGQQRLKAFYEALNAPGMKLPPIRAITKGPKFHWFGYYDKLEFDPTGRFVLGMEVDFENRSPQPDDVIKVGMVDLLDDDRWIELGQSRAWCWQQGCMLQWRPGSMSEVLWNDQQGDRFVCHILDVFTRKKRTIPRAIYTVSPDGRTALGVDFSRIQSMRRGYGYAGVADPYKDDLAPKESGIFLIDLETGKSKLIISLNDVTKMPYYKPEELQGGKHWFNHLLFNPDATRFIFLNRWRIKGSTAESGYSGVRTRMFTASPDGEDIHLVDRYGGMSHFIWRDPTHILGWAWRPSHGSKYYLYEDRTQNVEAVAPNILTVNGHCSYLPGNEWILNDTNQIKPQPLYLYHVKTGKIFPLGAFASPPRYKGEWRCDLHPRISPDGTKVVIDSVHGGNGRQLYLIDISEIVNK